MSLDLGIDDPRADDVRALLATHLAFSRAATPEEYSFALDVEELIAPGITFFSARQERRLVGVAALRRLDNDHAEIKSMHTSATDRRQGVGRALVELMLSVAKAEGFRRVSLETGTTDEFAPARRLYTAIGFRPCEAFGDYSASPYNTFMTIGLDREATS